MKWKGRGLTALAATTTLAAALALAGATAANATTVYPPEGGTWEYGVIEPASTVFVYSHYRHPTVTHRASVQVSNGTLYRSNWVAPGIWANVDKPTGWFNNYAYYAVWS